MKRGPVRNLKSPPAKKRPRNKSDNNAMTATAEEVEVEVEDSDNAKKLESSVPVVTMRSRKSDNAKEVSIGEIYSL
jgi:hypothetical protein